MNFFLSTLLMISWIDMIKNIGTISDFKRTRLNLQTMSLGSGINLTTFIFLMLQSQPMNHSLCQLKTWFFHRYLRLIIKPQDSKDKFIAWNMHLGGLEACLVLSWSFLRLWYIHLSVMKSYIELLRKMMSRNLMDLNHTVSSCPRLSQIFGVLESLHVVLI